MPGIRGDDPTGLLGPVERQRVGRQVLAPKRRFEPFPQGLGLLQERGRSHPITQARGQRGGMALRRIDIALDLAQRDRALRRAAILVKNRVV